MPNIHTVILLIPLSSLRRPVSGKAYSGIWALGLSPDV